MSRRKVDIIGVPSDLGANTRGANMGPSLLRIAEVQAKVASMGYDVSDLGDVDVKPRETLSTQALESHYLQEIGEICASLKELTYRSRRAGHLPVVLGGDHSVAMGSIAGVGAAVREEGGQLGLLWFDAHADINTPETSPSQNIHGMPLAVLLGLGHAALTQMTQAPIDPKKVALVGVREIDEKERDICKSCGVHYFSLADIDRRGMHAVMEEALAIVTAGTTGFHVSFDIDGVDPLFAPGVSTAVNGGLTYRESHLAMEMVAERGGLTSIDFVELNPVYDNNKRTANLIIELLQSALGKAII